MCFFILTSGGYMESNSIRNYFSDAKSITILKNDEKFCYTKGDDKFEEILAALLSATKNSHDMPALGVSIDSETKSAIQSGSWIELQFNKTMSFNEMPFDALLIQIEEDYQGINIIRKNNKKYDGRCFYLNLKSNMKHLSDIIKNIK